VTGSVPTTLASKAVGLRDRVRSRRGNDGLRRWTAGHGHDADRHPAEKCRNSVAVNLAGPGNSQRQFNAGAIARLFGVEQQLRETGSARLRWFQQDDSVCAFVETDGGSA